MASKQQAVQGVRYSFMELHAGHLPQLKELCRQIEPTASPEQLQQFMDVTELALAGVPGPVRFSIMGAGVESSDEVLAFAVTAQNALALTTKTAELSSGDMAATALRAQDALMSLGAQPEDHAITLIQVVVDAQHRRRGLGRRLLQLTREGGLRTGAKYMLLSCDSDNAACPLFASEGFKQVYDGTGAMFVSTVRARKEASGSSPAGARPTSPTSSSARQPVGASLGVGPSGSQGPTSAAAPPNAAQPPPSRAWGQSFQRPRKGSAGGGGGGAAGSGSGSGSSSSTSSSSSRQPSCVAGGHRPSLLGARQQVAPLRLPLLRAQRTVQQRGCTSASCGVARLL